MNDLRNRIAVIDITRGLVMVLMALDHVRDLLHVTSISQQPTDLNTTNTAFFFTRWITHLCAPTFVFLSGVSVWLSLKRSGSLIETRRFLISRGLVLILIEFTLVNFGLWFDIHFGVFLFDVIAAIGTGFIILGLLLGQSEKTIGIVGLAIIFLHSLLSSIPLGEPSVLKQLISFLFVPGALPIFPSHLFVMGYPPIPWLGIMLAGFAAGKWFDLDTVKRRHRFAVTGLLAILLFIVIRAINLYGDTFPWSVQRSGWFTVLSFINVTKYPPSLDFILLFLGGMFLLMALLDGRSGRWTDYLKTFGKVPLFYFVVHWYLIHPIMFAMVFLQGFGAEDLVFGFNFGRPKEGSGLELWAIYLVWIGIVIALYPACKWYAEYKERNKGGWVRFL